MAVAGAVSADLVQLVLDLPLSAAEDESPGDPPARSSDTLQRAPVAFPILFDHVLTHIVAELCDVCGRARARSDSLELVWPAPFSKRGSFHGTISMQHPSADIVARDCVGLMKIGFLARVLQILLGLMQIEPESTSIGRRVLVLKSIQQFLKEDSLSDSERADQWLRGCDMLVVVDLAQEANMPFIASSAYGSNVTSRFREACKVAANAAVLFLANTATMYQIINPGFSVDQDKKKSGVSNGGEFSSLSPLNALITEMGLARIDQMMESSSVRHVVSTWFKSACDHTMSFLGDSSQSTIQRRLGQTEGFKVYDWPLDTCKVNEGENEESDKKSAAFTSSSSPEPQDHGPMELDTYQYSACAVDVRSNVPGNLASFSTKKTVPLLGRYVEDQTMQLVTNPRPRIYTLPTSYTDLYAELGALCPNSKKIALCCICGEVLNANGKSECTNHSFKCGAGAGACIFFLLQEWQGRIMHNGKSVYVQSPYVDSHGETPQYPGRPLNLDLDRYDIFRELWTGHGIRQKVVQERGSARQVIITDFY